MMITMITIQEESGALQLFTAETIKSVLRTERNQQMMSDVNFMSAVLATCRHHFYIFIKDHHNQSCFVHAGSA